MTPSSCGGSLMMSGFASRHCQVTHHSEQLSQTGYFRSCHMLTGSLHTFITSVWMMAKNKGSAVLMRCFAVQGRASGTHQRCGVCPLRRAGSAWCHAAMTALCACGAVHQRMEKPGGGCSPQPPAAMSVPSSASTGPDQAPLPQVGCTCLILGIC
jgi:hypothetical protein